MEARKNWQEEKRSSHLYRGLAKIETNPIHKKLFADLAVMADKQAAIWQKSLQGPVPDYSPDFRVRLILWLVRRFGARSLRTALAAMKIRGMSIYQNLERGHPQPSGCDEVEGQHKTIQHGNNIRAAIFGINDGLVSNASLILGIAGAQGNAHMILLTGVAGLLAGACSMGAGEYISVRSQREMLEYQLQLERSELELYPEEEAMELALIYQARGIPEEEAIKVANLLIKDPEKALETLAREELGINPQDLVSPWGAAISSFISFGLGAFIPLVPFTVGRSASNILISILLTAISLFTVGVLISLFTQRTMLWSGCRMLLIGTAAGGITYFIGGLLI